MAEKMKAKTKVVKKKKARVVPSGVAHIHSTRNNTIVTFTDPNGNVVAWSSSGAIGYKGSKKSTPYAAQLAAAAAAEKAKESGMKEIKVVLKGTGPGKIAAAKQLENSKLKILEMKDSTPIAHNGTRPPKRVRKRLKG